MLATDQVWHKEEKRKNWITCGISEYLPIYRIANKAGGKYNTIQYNTIDNINTSVPKKFSPKVL